MKKTEVLNNNYLKDFQQLAYKTFGKLISMKKTES